MQRLLRLVTIVITTFAVLSLCEHQSFADSDAPQASFGIDEDFVTVRVSRSGTIPLVAKLRVDLPNGEEWAIGETNEEGFGQFPRPNTPACMISITISDVPSPGILLTFVDQGKTVLPLVSPLVPSVCCKSRSSDSKSTLPEGSTSWQLKPEWLFFSIFMLAIPGVLIVADLKNSPEGRIKS